MTTRGTEIQINFRETPQQLITKLSGLSDSDFFDAYCMFQWLVIRASRRYGENSSEHLFWHQVNLKLGKSLKAETLMKQKQATNLKTAMDMMKHGIKMVEKYLRDF